MQKRMSIGMRGQIVNQAGKISIFRVTGHVRPKLDFSRIRGKIQHQLHAWFLSKNVMLHNNPSIIVPFTLGDLFLPTT
jgi:hypothetical protein